MNQFDNIFKFSFILLLFALFIVIEVSSAYNINFVSIELINKFDMSLIYKMNSSGPSIDHWGKNIDIHIIWESIQIYVVINLIHNKLIII